MQPAECGWARQLSVALEQPQVQRWWGLEGDTGWGTESVCCILSLLYISLCTPASLQKPSFLSFFRLSGNFLPKLSLSNPSPLSECLLRVYALMSEGDSYLEKWNKVPSTSPSPCGQELTSGQSLCKENGATAEAALQAYTASGGSQGLNQELGFNLLTNLPRYCKIVQVSYHLTVPLSELPIPCGRAVPWAWSDNQCVNLAQFPKYLFVLIDAF